jgi:hypothetical protein
MDKANTKRKRTSTNGAAALTAPVPSVVQSYTQSSQSTGGAGSGKQAKKKKKTAKAASVPNQGPAAEYTAETVPISNKSAPQAKASSSSGIDDIFSDLKKNKKSVAMAPPTDEAPLKVCSSCIAHAVLVLSVMRGTARLWVLHCAAQKGKAFSGANAAPAGLAPCTDVIRSIVHCCVFDSLDDLGFIGPAAGGLYSVQLPVCSR